MASMKRKAYFKFRLMDADVGGYPSVCIRINPFASIFRQEKEDQ
jgi:hypothetical protein